MLQDTSKHDERSPRSRNSDEVDITFSSDEVDEEDEDKVALKDNYHRIKNPRVTISEIRKYQIEFNNDRSSHLGISGINSPEN